MILDKETEVKLGYTASSLPSKSHKLVVCTCDYCGDKFDRIRAKCNDHKQACKNCTAKKRTETNLARYGCENPFGSSEIKDKIRKTNLDKFGSANPSSSEDIKEHKKKIYLSRYGVASPLEHKEFLAKAKETTLARFGVENAMLSEEVRKKLINTNLEKFGTSSPLGNKEIQEKIKQTNLSRYGFPSAMQNEGVQAKVQVTNLSRHGVACNLSLPEVKEKAANAIKVYRATQTEIMNWLKELGYEFKSDRKILNGKEIDLYNDELKLGIEYCGLYWHNESSPEPRTRSYHYNKYLACRTQGIRLITIFEDEWLNRQAQVKSYLKSLLQKNTRYSARKCEVRMLDKKIATKFFDENHIQGSTRGSKYFGGLFHNEVLVGAMSFGSHPRKNELVLDRLCFKQGITVVGGASKLFKYMLANLNVSSIISWSDNRWSAGGVYSELGFTKDAELPPDYSYVQIKNPKCRQSKQSQKKGNTACPEGKTERVWNLERGLTRIWDCGKIRWSYNNKQ